MGFPHVSDVKYDVDIGLRDNEIPIPNGGGHFWVSPCVTLNNPPVVGSGALLRNIHNGGDPFGSPIMCNIKNDPPLGQFLIGFTAVTRIYTPIHHTLDKNGSLYDPAGTES